MSAVLEGIGVWILRIVVWLIAFLIGQWLAAQIHWAPVIGAQFAVWRLLVMVAAFIAIMVLLDKLWRPSAPSKKWTAREYVDAAIVGFFVGAAFVR
jgi:hypothetical protein